MAFKMKGFTPFTKEKNIEGTKHDKSGGGKTDYQTKSTGKTEYDKLPTWKKIFKTPPGVTTGYAPGVGGKTKSTKKVFDAFSRVAKNAKNMNKKIQKMLEKKGKKIISSPKSPSRGNFFGPKS